MFAKILEIIQSIISLITKKSDASDAAQQALTQQQAIQTQQNDAIEVARQALASAIAEGRIADVAMLQAKYNALVEEANRKPPTAA